MSKKSKNPRKGRREQSVKVETPQPAAVSAPKPKESKNKRYKDLLVGPGTELYEAMEGKDEAKVEKIYQKTMKEWRASPGYVDCDKVNRQIREQFMPWSGYYLKVSYDVLLKTGEIKMNCWPNAGFMMTIDGSGGQYTVDDVEGVRPAIDPPY